MNSEIEMMKVDSNRCHAAIRKLKNKNKKNELYVHDEDGNLGGTDSAKANYNNYNIVRHIVFSVNQRCNPSTQQLL